MAKSINFLNKHFPAFIALLVIVFVSVACFKSDAEWKRLLSNKQLATAKTSGAISDKVSFYFCPSGEYARKTDFVGMSGDFSMANEDVELGNWKVESGTLILKSEKGKTYEYSISQGMDTDVISLDGSGYLVSSQNECDN